MKPFNYLILAGLAILMLTTSCENEKEKAAQLIVSGKVVSRTDCKSLKSNAVVSASDSLSCAEYSYNEASYKLVIKHINAGFNCCPDSVYGNVTFSNDTIVIEEFESKPSCNCDCLYDLDIEIEGVVSQKYQIRFIEPYCGNQQQLIFGVDLASQKEGSFCVTRNQYPWGK
jgi:hypothetical protein